MIEVFFETNASAEYVASFTSEDLYMACLPVLEEIAKERDLTITERYQEGCEV